MSRYSTIAGNKRGFLLYEVLLALAILSIGLVAVLHCFSTSLRAVGTSQNHFKATLLLEEKLWEVEREKSLTPGIYQGNFPGKGFKWEVETSPIEEEGEVSLNAVRVTISWSEGGRKRHIGLTTWICKEIKQ